MSERAWPSREEWARNHRTAYADMMPDASDAIADYATPEEVAALKLAMRERWKELGRQLKAGDAEELHYQCRCINRGLKLIEQGELPSLHPEDCAGAKDLLAPFHARYEAAREELHKRKAEEIAQMLINDAAWAKELQRRARIELAG